jgi:hypothetical protein
VCYRPGISQQASGEMCFKTEKFLDRIRRTRGLCVLWARPPPPYYYRNLFQFIFYHFASSWYGHLNPVRAITVLVIVTKCSWLRGRTLSTLSLAGFDLSFFPQSFLRAIGCENLEPLSIILGETARVRAVSYIAAHCTCAEITASGCVCVCVCGILCFTWCAGVSGSREP